MPQKGWWTWPRSQISTLFDMEKQSSIYIYTCILVYIYYTWYKLHTIWSTIYIYYISKAGINQPCLMVSGLTIAVLTLYTCLRKSTGVRNDQGVLQMVATPQFHLAGEKTKRDVRRFPQKLIVNYNIIVTWTIITMITICIYNGISWIIIYMIMNYT